jgi:hypothetical protein
MQAKTNPGESLQLNALRKPVLTTSMDPYSLQVRVEAELLGGSLVNAESPAFFLDSLDHAILMNYAALLNWQWGRTGGPKTNEEKLIFWTLVVNGSVDGATYISGGMYGPLGCMVSTQISLQHMFPEPIHCYTQEKYSRLVPSTYAVNMYAFRTHFKVI